MPEASGQSAVSAVATEPPAGKIEKRRDDPDIPPPSLTESKPAVQQLRGLTEAIAEPPPLALDNRIGLSGATARPPFPAGVEPKLSLIHI